MLFFVGLSTFDSPSGRTDAWLPCFFSQSSRRVIGRESHFQCVDYLLTSLLSVQFSPSVTSNTLRPHGLQHVRPPCPSPAPRAHTNSCPLSQRCHPTISSSVVPFSFCFRSFSASGSFQMSLIKGGFLTFPLFLLLVSPPIPRLAYFFSFKCKPQWDQTMSTLSSSLLYLCYLRPT